MSVCGWEVLPGLMCGAAPSVHVIWTLDHPEVHGPVGTVLCVEHERVVRADHVFYAAHPPEAPCLAPGWVYDREQNRCVEHDDGGEADPAMSAARELVGVG